MQGQVYNRIESAAKDAANEAARKAEKESRLRAAKQCMLQTDANYNACLYRANETNRSNRNTCGLIGVAGTFTAVAGTALTNSPNPLLAGGGYILVGIGGVAGVGSTHCYETAAAAMSNLQAA